MAANAGLTSEEKFKYVKEFIKQVHDGDRMKSYTDDVKQVGTWANEVNAASGRVTRGLSGAYRDEWIAHNTRWFNQLEISRIVASERIIILRSIDKILLSGENIVTDQDRKDVVAQLQPFVDEQWQEMPITIAQGFLSLKRDIEEFAKRLDKSTVSTYQAGVNRGQLKGNFDGVKPDIALICDRLLLFTEVWVSIYILVTELIERFKSAMGAVTILRFKKELQLARSVCGAIEDKLGVYVAKFNNRKAK